jgi:hypothetical protein
VPDGWEDSGLQSITIPGDAGPSDPRIYVGQDDPIATSLSQDAAIVLYWAANRAFLISVEQSGGPNTGQLHIWSSDEINGLKQVVDIEHDVPGNNVTFTVGEGGHFGQTIHSVDSSTTIELDSLTETIINSDTVVRLAPTTARVELHGQSIEEWVNGAVIIANSAAVGAAETTVITLPAFTYKANTVYKAVISGGATASVAANNVIVRLRKTNPAGQQFQFRRVDCTLAATTYHAGMTLYFQVGAANVTATLVVTIQGGGAFNAVMTGAPTSPSACDIYVDGDVNANRTSLPTLV